MKGVVYLTVALVSLNFCCTISAEEVRLHGATTTVDRLINRYKEPIERMTGYTLTVIGNATGKGLVDLIEGQCDAALTSEPLDVAVLAAKTAGKEVKAEDLQLYVAKNDEIVFVVHPSNPVKTLTWQQIKDIHTGKIKNWKDVDGPDMPILVVTDAVTGGTRAMIRKVVLEGEEYGIESRPLGSVKQVFTIVSEFQNAFGGLGIGFVNPQRAKIIETEKLLRPLGFITFGKPSEKVKKVIDAFTTEASKAGQG
jgi:phosphate transport system substrate-binding protein